MAGRRKKTIIHVNQHTLRANKKRAMEDVEPCLTVKTYNSNEYAFDAVILDDDGTEVARVVYRPHKPLSCGAHCWIETHMDVETRMTAEEAEHGTGDDRTAAE